jgi:hypothetical protein
LPNGIHGEQHVRPVVGILGMMESSRSHNGLSDVSVEQLRIEVPWPATLQFPDANLGF